MTLRKLAAKIAKVEGKKSQARMGDIMEILAILSDMMLDEEGYNEICETLCDAGDKRAKRKKK